jgi:hypothetical protein
MISIDDIPPEGAGNLPHSHILEKGRTCESFLPGIVMLVHVLEGPARQPDRGKFSLKSRGRGATFEVLVPTVRP